MLKVKLIESLQQIKDLVDQCLAGLQSSTKPQLVAKEPAVSKHAPKPTTIEFDKPIRPFIKLYAKGMNGAKKFTLLLSKLVNGDLKQEVALPEIKKHWNKMKSKDLLGIEFNRKYPAEAKNNDWVDSKKIGIYNLRPSWKDIFKTPNV